MSGPVSKRKDNFPMIIQHDLPLPKEAMGGPLLTYRVNALVLILPGLIELLFFPFQLI